MVVRKFVLSLLLMGFMSGMLVAQESYAGKGLLRMQGTLAPAFQPKLNLLNFYLHGDLEYFVSDKISIRSDSYYLLGSQQKPELFDQKFMNFFGAVLHFPYKRLDPFVGFEPGIAFSSVHYTSAEGQQQTSELVASPLISPVAGVNLYVGKYIHFFAMLRYIYGRHLSDAPKAVTLSEINGSFGLGWNFQTRK